MNREQSIAWLRSMGRNPRARDWVLGETIVIPVGQSPADDDVGPIARYRGAVFLYPTADGGWNLLDLDLPDPVASYADLETATHAAHAYVGEKELALREP